MNRQILARKYRPQSFDELIGQEHIVKALKYAFSNNILHHAYLFSGTRGVGKTTIGRLVAKCLNCETGTTSKPCGVCDTCISIASGSFIDLIEVDAASNTGVDNIRDLLKDVDYVPVKGRFKIYLIDEVHMLSISAFNALLKTLEEPPEYIKFIFATTDSHKIPITVLSRCLQFKLKNLPEALIVTQVENILNKEQIDYSKHAVSVIASEANGSVRDALSITDEAILFGEGKITDEAVLSIFGATGIEVRCKLINAIFTSNMTEAFDCLKELSLVSIDWSRLLDELIADIHAMSLTSFGISEVNEFYKNIDIPDPEVLQLYYQLFLQAKKDIFLAPNFKFGFEMLILRLLAFIPSDFLKKNNLIYLKEKTNSSSEIFVNNIQDSIELQNDNAQIVNVEDVEDAEKIDDHNQDIIQNTKEENVVQISESIIETDIKTYYEFPISIEEVVDVQQSNNYEHEQETIIKNIDDLSNIVIEMPDGMIRHYLCDTGFISFNNNVLCLSAKVDKIDNLNRSKEAILALFCKLLKFNIDVNFVESNSFKKIKDVINSRKEEENRFNISLFEEDHSFIKMKQALQVSILEITKEH